MPHQSLFNHIASTCGVKIATLFVAFVLTPAFGWETFHGATPLTGVATQPVGENPGIIWRLATGAPVSFPCLMNSERIYAFNDQGEVVACDYKGRALWRWRLPQPASMQSGEHRRFGNTGVLVENGLAVAGENGDVFLLDKTTGNIIWKRPLKIDVIAPLSSTLSNGKELILVNDQATGAIHALQTRTGEQVWESRRKGRSDCPPAAADGRIVYGSCLAQLHVLSSENGKALTNIELGQDCQIAAGAALSGNQAIVGDRAGNLTAVDITAGTIIWRETLDAGAIFTTPAVTPAYTAVGTDDKTVLVVKTQTGELIWKKELSLTPSSPAIAGNQLVTTDDGVIYIFKLTTGEPIWKRAISDSISPVAINHGVIVFGTDEGEIIAVKGKKGE